MHAPHGSHFVMRLSREDVHKPVMLFRKAEGFLTNSPLFVTDDFQDCLISPSDAGAFCGELIVNAVGLVVQSPCAPRAMTQSANFRYKC